MTISGAGSAETKAQPPVGSDSRFMGSLCFDVEKLDLNASAKVFGQQVSTDHGKFKVKGEV